MRLAYYPTTRQFSNRPAAELAAKLAALTPGDLRYTMFAVSGSEANERSMQIARQYWLATGKPGKHKVISLEGGYHGATMGTFAVCGLPHLSQAYAPLAGARLRQGDAAASLPRPWRAAPTPSWSRAAIAELREAIVREGPDTVSAVILEPVLSSGGFIMPPIGWLRAVRAICDELDVLMIADEVITGFGRTGRWFAVRARRRRARPHVGGQGHHLGLHPALGQHRARPARRRVLRRPPPRRTCTPTPTRRIRWPARPRSPTCASWSRTSWWRTRRRWARGCSRACSGRWASTRSWARCAAAASWSAWTSCEPDGSGKPLDAKLVAELDRKAWDRGAIIYARGTVLRLAPPLCITAAEVDELVGVVADCVDSLQRDVAAGR